MFYGFVTTETGNRLLASMVAGETLTITRVVMDKGTAESPEAARKLVAPIDPGPEGTSNIPTAEGNTANLIVEYRSDLNGGLEEGFWIGGFGIYGSAGGAEAMIGYGSLGDAKQYVSAYVPDTAPDVRRYPVSITVTSGAQVVIGYPAEAWMTAEDVDDKVSKHNSSGESHKDIRTALSNKLSRNGKLVPLGTNILTLSPGRYSIDGVTEDTWAQMNLPVLVWHYEIVVLGTNDEVGLINNYKVITVYPFGYSQGYIESFTNEMQYDGTWTGWVKNTTATPPQEYPLPLTEGFTPITPCTYRKNQFSEVFVGGSTGGTITDGTVIATLPEGFRPKQIVERPATFAVSGAQAAGSVTIMPDGNVSVHGQSADSGVVFSANFVVDE